MGQGPKVCVGTITGAQGLKGAFKVKSFTEDPRDIATYGPLYDKEGRLLFELELMHPVKGIWVARTPTITTREASEALKGTELYVDRSLLPEVLETETYYHADLEGMTVKDTEGNPLGHVEAVHDFGAGPLLEIFVTASKKSYLMPFTTESIPEVRPDQREVHVQRSVLESFQN